MTKGKIAVHTENIFPIIKRWLYSDKDIFIRELVSNGCDAISKFTKLVSVGESDSDTTEYRVDVIIDKENKKLIFSDNGLGMDKDEIEKYITQVAFSGAEEFLEKYKDNIDESSNIIGHFGLGFYSAFMVANKVSIDSLSYKSGAIPAHWECDGGIDYEMSDGTRDIRGTDIILEISPENEEFLEVSKVTEILTKYCYFLPTKIFVKEQGKEDSEDTLINDLTPLWLKKPSECTDEEYKDFYTKVFHDSLPPLFYIHLNVDYPFNLKGILYFPKLHHEFGSSEGQIKLYNNQVFVADNIKEVIPEYLLSLKGCIDCPDLPLNVSRSFLQNDGYVKKVSAHITKKVADKLTELFTSTREDYEKYWDDINPFVKFGCMKEDTFYDRMKDNIIYKTINDRYVTLDEYLSENKASHENKVYYVSNPETQAQYISMFKSSDINAIVMPYGIDNYFINFMEYKRHDIKFERIDAGVAGNLTDDGSCNDEELINTFKSSLSVENLKIECANLKDTNIPAIITVDEQARRLQEMGSFMGNGFNLPTSRTLVININNPVVKNLKNDLDTESNELICRYIFDLAQLAHSPLNSEQMGEFLLRSNKILEKFSGK